MSQLAIDFSASKHARRLDPNTSKEAAVRAGEFALSHCERILGSLKQFGPMSKDEIAKKTGLTPVQVDRRLPDLKSQKLALPSGLTRESDSGMPERIWVAT